MSHQENRHQAEQLEKVFQEVKNHEAKLYDKDQSTSFHQQENEHPEIDILNLPPRSEVHNTTEQRWKFKLSKATWRLVLIVLVLLLISLFLLYDVLYLQRIVLFHILMNSFIYTVDIFSYIWR